MQELKAQVTIRVPDGHVIVEETYVEELKSRAEPEWVSGLKWLANQTGIGNHQTLKEKLLYPYRDELEDYVNYPDTQGELWRFNTYPMKHWLRTNFTKVGK